MSIVNDCMVVNLQIGLWMGYRFDRDATRRTLMTEGAAEDAARVNKHLIPKEALKRVVTAVGALRSQFYEQTLPWKDNGDRLLTRKMYMHFIQEHAKLKEDFNNEVEHFLSVSYMRARDNARLRLGDMFKDNDYPETWELRQKFYVNLDIDAVTMANDFRVTLDQDQLDVVRKDMESAIQARISRAVGDVWERLSDKLTRFHDRVSDKDAVFKTSTVETLRELVAMLPQLNITNDPHLEQIGLQIERAIAGVDATTLRKDKAVRADVADEVKKIMDDMSGFMNAFGAK